jgi:hypothetical protein
MDFVNSFPNTSVAAEHVYDIVDMKIIAE